MDRKKQQQRIEQLVNQWATEVLKEPPEGREAALRRIKDGNYRDAIAAGATEDAAREMSAKMDEFTRALIRVIENSGGAAGGTA